MPDSISPEDLARWRMATLGLGGPLADTAAGSVQRLFASQSQDYRIALWAVAQRAPGMSAADVEAEFADGGFIRTHALRPTWHFVHRDDLRLILGVTASRVHVQNGSIYRREGLDPHTLDKSHHLIENALSGGNHLTRADLADVLGRGGVEASGLRLVYILMHAELEQLICSGSPKGKTQTYALFDERVPATAGFDRDDAVAEFVYRYFASHGPATIKDLRWWSSLTMAEIDAGLATMSDRFETIALDDMTFWFTGHVPDLKPPGRPVVQLLQGFDEYTVGFQESRGVVDLAGDEAKLFPTPGIAQWMLVVDGQIAGRWRHTMRRHVVSIEAILYRPLDTPERDALQAAVRSFGEYLGLKAAVSTNQI